MTFRLEDRAIVALSGPEAAHFLQGLITHDVRGVDAATLTYAALLTPQGKILFDFLMGERDGALLLDCPASARDALVKRLSLYRLRAKVDIAVRDDLAVDWLSGNDAPAPFIRDPRHPGLGFRAIVESRATAADPGAKQFQAVRLGCGVPEGRDFGQDKIFALDADLDELGAIAFDKGCYVGQELTARMKHRGTARKRLLLITAEAGAALPAADTSIIAAGREIGTVHSTYGERGFALLRLDRLTEAADATLQAGGIGIIVTKPDWLFP